MKLKYVNPLVTLFLASWGTLSSAETEDDWEIIVAPYVWGVNITGDASVGRAGAADVDLDFDDILESLETGGMGHFEVRKGRWGVFLDTAYMKLGDDISTPVRSVLDIEVELLELEMYLTYRLIGDDENIVDAYAGARYYDLDLDLELSGGLINRSISRGDDWVDPVVGLRGVHYLSDKWYLAGRGDIGGFGAGSDLSWNILGGVGYQFNDRFSLLAQYRALAVDFENDDKGTKDFFQYDTITHGPVFGFVFKL